jgi:hypothetical protein
MSTSPTARHSTANAQLSLFPELTEAELGDNSIEESIDDRTGYTHTTGTQDPGALEPPSSTMVEMLNKGNQLQQAVFAAQELTGNLLYELMVVQRMDYQFAWEIATREWAFLPDEEDQPQLSFDPATLDPHQPLPAISA